MKPVVIDMFCGAGGESVGIKAAMQGIELHAINHWERAIETHAVNFPDAEHHPESVENLDPIRVIPGKKVKLLWASPECTHHSNAAGGRPKSNQSRSSAWLVLKWLSDLYVERVIIENVKEFMSWGPLDAEGYVIPSQKGKTFRAFISSIRSLGYTVDYRVLCAADYGTPTTRERLFIQAVKGKKRIIWPESQFSNEPEIFQKNKWIPARDIIDWSIPGGSILNRKKALAPATLRRIESGIKKYWGKYAEPFLVILRGTSDVRNIDKPLPSITAGGGHFGIVEPLFIPQHSCGTVKPISDPLSTVTTSGAIGLIEPFITQSEHGERIHGIDKPFPTVTCSSRGFGLVQPFIVKYNGKSNSKSIMSPLDAVTCKDRFGIVSGGDRFDITFRMFQPHELAAAQGFPRDYIITGNKTEQVRQIGNAVPCPLAEALVQEVAA